MGESKHLKPGIISSFGHRMTSVWNVKLIGTFSSKICQLLVSTKGKGEKLVAALRHGFIWSESGVP